MLPVAERRFQYQLHGLWSRYSHNDSTIGNLTVMTVLPVSHCLTWTNNKFVFLTELAVFLLIQAIAIWWLHAQAPRLILEAGPQLMCASISAIPVYSMTLDNSYRRVLTSPPIDPHIDPESSFKLG